MVCLGRKDCNSQSAPVRLPGATKECRLTALLESGLSRTASQPASHGPGLLRCPPHHSQCRGCPDQEGVSWDRSWVMCWGRAHLLFQIDLPAQLWASKVNPVSSLAPCSLLGWLWAVSGFPVHHPLPSMPCLPLLGALVFLTMKWGQRRHLNVILNIMEN